ncbi:demethoxyubiquinone hydroxylase family protein [Candidatus Odyssella acanthamoebae]|uniref:3-demethoxyubiquinol 3-hydroxylase n=1 Tax=Candidatus Odyssella acanthamoebae TaxID=91604 RepID=A0A077ATU1_9PROT|nr:demethoxyubiquinone hydroxylase family protein [Candidatus Paracaedibacter acanthamoebae]AIK95811.1 ubiquinone biosynthesis protein UbiB [Candidatus Paracaedibacter acanthamoebae]
MREPKKLSKELEAMIRVDQAGEFGATRIYAGQLAVLKNSTITPTLQHMADQEQVHLKTFNDLCVTHGVQPTILQPLWHVGGFMMGAVTAFISEKAAHACTIAVEEVIADHYQSQLDRLGHREPELSSVIAKFRDEELEHKDHAEQEGGREAPAYQAITSVVKKITKTAIWLSERI